MLRSGSRCSWGGQWIPLNVFKGGLANDYCGGVCVKFTITVRLWQNLTELKCQLGMLSANKKLKSYCFVLPPWNGMIALRYQIALRRHLRRHQRSMGLKKKSKMQFKVFVFLISHNVKLLIQVDTTYCTKRNVHSLKWFSNLRRYVHPLKSEKEIELSF